MKVLQIIQRRQLRGAEMFACQLARELNHKGVQIDIAYVFDHPDDLPGIFPDLRFIPLKGNPAKRFWDLGAYRRLAKLIVDHSYDLVQANAGDTLKYAVLSRMLHRWKASLIFRNANQISGFLKNGFHRSLTKFFLKQCDYIVSVSELCRQDMLRICPPAEDRSKTIPIGSYLFEDIPPVDEPVPGDEPLFINMSSFVPEKNHELLVDVFHAFYSKHRKGYLWLIGNGSMRDRIAARIKEKGIQERVVLWGYRKDAIALLKRANVMVMTSRVEGLPGVILEAFACGVPVVSSAVGGIPEVIRHGETGFLVEGFGIDPFVDSLEKLIFDRPLREAVIENAKASFDKSYTMELISRNFLNTYRDLIEI